MIIWSHLSSLFANNTYLSKISVMCSFFHSLFKQKNIIKKSCLALGIVCLLISSSVISKPKVTRNILILNSYNQDMTWVRSLTQGIQDILDSDEFDYIFHIENMASKRHYDDLYFDALFNLYTEKYKSTSLDLILSSDNNAFNFLRQHTRAIFPNVPIVFSGLNEFKAEQIAEYPEFTGVTEEFSDVDTIKTMLEFHPEAKEIFIINDYTLSGKAWTKTMVDNFYKANLDTKIRVTFAENLAFDELKGQLKKLGDNVIVLLGVYFKDKNGNYLTFEKIQKELLDNIDRPIYALLNFNISDNVIGGKVIGGYSQGVAAAKLGLKILQGTPPINISVVQEDINQYVFNWPQLEKWHIKLDSLPKDSVILNRPLSIYYQNKGFIWGVITVFILLLSTLFIQLWKSSIQKSANKKLEKIVYKRTMDLSIQRKMLEDISHLSATGGWEFNIPTEHLSWSKEIYTIFELPQTFVPTVNEAIDYFTDESKPIISQAIEEAVKNGVPYDLELSMITAKGRSIWVRALCKIVYHQGEKQALIGAMQDITERKRADDKIRRLAMTDSLTGLANRTQFEKRFEQSIKLANRENKSLALMMIDLDKFKAVNDTFGHPVGDELLKAVAKVFTDNARETDVIARLGGDEFAILVIHPDKPESVGFYAQRIIDGLAETFIVQGNAVNIGSSVGISICPQDACEEEGLLKKADAALYESKSNGGGIYTYYQQSMDLVE